MAMAILTYLLLAGLALASVYLLGQRPKRVRKRPDIDALPSLLVPAYTTHARLLPITSKHAFSYPLLYLAIDIDSLEGGQIDLPRQLLSYGGHPLSKILGIRSDGYLEQGQEGLRRKLVALLVDRGVAKEDIGRVWLVTMPSYLGFEGINPLSVWYVYRAGTSDSGARRSLMCVVLEVHNTFGEKHAYVLHTESELKHDPSSGFDLAWTFPRSFHVSPFNSRDGFYRLDIVDPFLHSKSDSQPEVRVFLRLLTPDKTPKLQALLASSPNRPSIPLDRTNLIQIATTVLSKYPFALLFTTPRILYQAYLLHYEKKLDVFPRPEPKTKEAEQEWNPPQVDELETGVAIGWQKHSWTERKAQAIVQAWASKRSRETGINLTIRFRYPRHPLIVRPTKTDDDNSLVITTSDPKFFTNLLAFTTRHILTLAPELLSSISDPSTFLSYFESSQVDLAHSVRERYLAFFWLHSYIAPSPDLLSTPVGHFASQCGLVDQVWVWFIVWTAWAADVAEEWIMYVLGARFVEGREPWRIYERALRRMYVGG
ncbi:hypothetical protein BCR39DRAFT_595395 [Naematelia encephala]|uniref:Uncharacterized protein n=1 Tax=Naematelia encephala TaxID=71784 RepID=A0A1Y2ANT8_9TREE|nr:hypothetical protein BCR39DRAFT_595395 [Naematelia encephala]